MKTLVVLAALVAFAFADDGHHRGGYGGYRGGYGGYRGGYGYGGHYGGYYYKRCPKLPAPHYGSVKLTGTKPGSIATYSCDECFNLMGEETRKCQKNGKWSGEAPTCEIVDCGAPDAADPNGSLAVENTTYLSIATYSCNSGYLVDTSGGGSQKIICQCDGTWSDTAPACIPVDCGCIDSPKNGNVRFDPDTTLDSKARFTCNFGFELIGSDESCCEEDGQWSDDTPSCRKMQCPEVDPPKNTKIEYERDRCIHTYATYSCTYGYVLASSKVSRRKCQLDETWSDPEPKCIRRKYYGYGHGRPRYGHHGH